MKTLNDFYSLKEQNLREYILKKKRNNFCILQWFFYSGLATIMPYVYSTHPKEIGLSTFEKTCVHLFSSLFSSLICTIIILRNFNIKLLLHFKPLLTTFLIVAVLSHVALLFVPKTQKINRLPRIIFNCTDSGSFLQIEVCQNLEQESFFINHYSFFDKFSSIKKKYNSFQCNKLLKTTNKWSLPKYKKYITQNFESSSKEPNYKNDFTTFSMIKCKGVCQNDFIADNEPKKYQLLYYYDEFKIKNNKKFSKLLKSVMDTNYDAFNGNTQMCFKKKIKTKTCYTLNYNNFNSLNIQNNDIFDTNSTIYSIDQILFQSKIQFWHLINPYPQLPNQIFPYPSCSFKQTIPVLINGKKFETITCPSLNVKSQNFSKIKTKRSNYKNCDTICSTNLIHKNQFKDKYFDQYLKQFPFLNIICHDIIGNKLITFYSYLTIRCVSDFSLMICFLVIDNINIYYTANFDTMYGGLQKAICFGSSTFIWSITSGFLIDYYSKIVGKIDYSPAFILFSGLFLIASSVVAILKIAPNINEFKCVKKNYNLSNAFVSDLCEIDSYSYMLESFSILKFKKTKNNLSVNGNLLSINSSKNKTLFLFIMPFILALGLFFSICQLQMNSYYLILGSSNLWIGFVFSLSFIFSFIFIIIAKPLVVSIGRANLISIGFVFYSLQLFGNSLLNLNSKWSLIPFNSMIAFSLVLAWIGCTSKLHSILKLNRLTHLKLQLWVILIKFGYGRILGSIIWLFWFYYFNEINKFWIIDYFNIIELDVNLIDKIEFSEINAFKFLLRFLSLLSLILGLIFFVFFHLFDKFFFNINEKKKNKIISNKFSDESF